jgi:CDP-ribitol ribitolphosphotransferase
MAFFAYDLDDYNDWRGFYYNYDELTPGPVCRSTEEIIDYIRSIGERFDPLEVAAFRERFMGSCDGHATERIEELVFGHSLR